MDITTLKKKTIKKLRAWLDSREIGAEELCAEYLKRIKASNPELQALITVTKEEAKAGAKAAQARINKKEAAALTGIPAVINDNILTSGIVTTCASKMLENFIPPYDAGVIEQLKKSDYVLLGKANMDEFSVGCSPKSGDAMGASLALYSIGSDTGGAVSLSAAFHGMTGLRPTYGRVSRYGLAAFAGSLDQIGPIAKTAEDCAMILNEIAGRDARDATCIGRGSKEDFTAKAGAGVKGLKIAVPKEFFGEEIAEEKRTAVMNAAKELEKQGAALIECSVGMVEYAVAVYYIVSSAEASSNLSRYDGVNFGLRGEGKTYFEQIVNSRDRGFGDEVKRRIMLGNFVLAHDNYAEYFQKALALRQKIRAEYDEILKTADIILTPTVPDIILGDFNGGSYGKEFMADIFTAPPALAGLPSVTTTCGYKKTGLPIGVSLTGRRLDEQTVIGAADCFERIFKPELFEEAAI